MATTDTTKVCCWCKQTLPSENYYKSAKNGLLGGCKGCRRLRVLVWRRDNRELSREKDRARVRDPAKMQAAQKRWYKTHRETAKARINAWKAKNTERQAQTRSVWKKNNGVRIAAIDSIWRKANPDKVRRAQAKYSASNIDKKTIWRRAHYTRNAERNRQRRRERYAADGDRARAHSIAWRKLNHEKVLAAKAIRRARKAAAPGAGWTAADVEAIKKMQRGRCAYCSTSFKSRFHRDHIVPLARGGAHDSRNLQLLCGPCNLSKGSRDPVLHARTLGLLI